MKSLAGLYPFSFSVIIVVSHRSSVGCLSGPQLTARSTEPEFLILNIIHSLLFFIFTSVNIAGYGTYLSLNRILTPNPDTNDPLYVVNIYQVSFYILLHKEQSVLGTYCRGQTSEPTRSAYVSLNLTILMREHFFFFFIFWTHVCGQSYIFCIRLNCGSKEKRGTC